MNKFKNYLFSGLYGALFLLAIQSFGQELKIGGQVGGYGTDKASSIGYGAVFGVNPYGWIAFQADFATGQIKSETHYYFSPAIVIYPVDFQEFRLGIIGGAGFYKEAGISTKFGTNGGISGDFNLTDSFAVGMQTRYHGVLDAPDLWTVFITASYRYELGGAW
jgi:hypothetical protein